jgi:hypothetical protein
MTWPVGGGIPFAVEEIVQEARELVRRHEAGKAIDLDRVREIVTTLDAYTATLPKEIRDETAERLVAAIQVRSLFTATVPRRKRTKTYDLINERRTPMRLGTTAKKATPKLPAKKTAAKVQPIKRAAPIEAHLVEVADRVYAGLLLVSAKLQALTDVMAPGIQPAVGEAEPSPEELEGARAPFYELEEVREGTR